MPQQYGGGAAPVPVPRVGATPLVADTFTRADDATHLGTADSGQAWATAGPGTLGVASGQAKFLSSASECYGLVDAGRADVYFEAQLLHNYSDLVFRCNAGATDYLGLQMQGGLCGFISLGGNGAVPGGQPRTDIHPGSNDVIGVACYGGSFVVYVNGVPFNATSTTTTAARLTATRVGVHGFAQGFDSGWDNLVVRALDSFPQVICDGDSLTYGSGAVTDGGYPEQLVKSLPAYRGWPQIYKNIGVYGQLLANMIPLAATKVDPLYAATHCRNLCAIWGGTNDLNNTPGGQAAVYALLKKYWADRRATGWQVVAFTLLPRSDGGASGTWETDRQALNTLIRSDATLYDALVDVGADATIGQAGQSTNTTYYNADGLHLVAAGYGVVAGLVKTALAGLA